MSKSRIVLVESEMGTFIPTPHPFLPHGKVSLGAFRQLTETGRVRAGLGWDQQETDVFLTWFGESLIAWACGAVIFSS